MNESQNKIIDKIEKLLALAGSDNENEARDAMTKARELMAKYEIRREQLHEGQEEERPVVHYTSPSFRDDWCQMVACVIANNFRCRAVVTSFRRSGGAYRIKFFGYDEDAEICVNIFNYAVKVVRKRFATLRAIYADAGREFARNEKMNYVEGFCYGLEKNFEEQKAQNESFALALVTPPAVVEYVDNIPGLQDGESREYETNKEHALLRQTGYIDGKAFQNAGDKDRIVG